MFAESSWTMPTVNISQYKSSPWRAPWALTCNTWGPMACVLWYPLTSHTYARVLTAVLNIRILFSYFQASWLLTKKNQVWLNIICPANYKNIPSNLSSTTSKYFCKIRRIQKLLEKIALKICTMRCIGCADGPSSISNVQQCFPALKPFPNLWDILKHVEEHVPQHRLTRKLTQLMLTQFAYTNCRSGGVWMYPVSISRYIYVCGKKTTQRLGLSELR